MAKQVKLKEEQINIVESALECLEYLNYEDCDVNHLLLCDIYADLNKIIASMQPGSATKVSNKIVSRLKENVGELGYNYKATKQNLSLYHIILTTLDKIVYLLGNKYGRRNVPMQYFVHTFDEYDDDTYEKFSVHERRLGIIKLEV